MEIKKFEIEFVERTRELLEKYEGPYDLTNLLNCTLGLIILPYERSRGKTAASRWDTELDRIPELQTLKLDAFEPIMKIDRKSGQTKYYPKTLKVLLQKIRNGIVHQHIEPVNRDGKFVGVIVRNYYNVEAEKDKDLEIKFSQEELKNFALFIADQYLDLSVSSLGRS